MVSRGCSPTRGLIGVVVGLSLQDHSCGWQALVPHHMTSTQWLHNMAPGFSPREKDPGERERENVRSHSLFITLS